MGIIYARKQQYDQAIAEGERAIALDPNNAEGYAGQANVLFFAGRPEDALRVIEQAMRLNPYYPAWYLQALGMGPIRRRDGLKRPLPPTSNSSSATRIF